MIKNFMVHGSSGPIDFFVFIIGANVSSTYFYEEDQPNIRFFSRGNEIILTPKSITYRGIGGGFCEYMFGVEKPMKDLVKKEIQNRLVMFGAFLDAHERLVFTNEIEGSETYQRLFLLGHAVENYYFLVSSDDKSIPEKRQKKTLGSVGKFLKRTDLISSGRDEELLDKLWTELNEPRSTIFLFKLVHRQNQEYYRAFQRFYAKDRLLTADEESYLDALARRYQIDGYQQERMKIDVMYKHPEDRSIVDEYRDILLGIARKESAEHSEIARLQRLRTLSIRNNVPTTLFDTLDELLLRGKKFQTIEEPEYLKEARAILANLFFSSSSLKRHIIKEDIVKLIRAKHMAHSLNDMGFDRLVLDIGKSCDEYAREQNDFSILEELGAIITYFDRYDNLYSSLSRIAFMENLDFSEDFLRGLVGNKKEFDTLDKNLFKELFITELLSNIYITSFGKKKIKLLFDGIAKIMRGDVSLKDVVGDVQKIAEEERLYKQIRTALKERMRESYTPLDKKKELSAVREETRNALLTKRVDPDTTDRIFDRVLLDLRKESYYLNSLLPQILKTGDLSLREDFLSNSGLDRFYVENIEKEYLKDTGGGPLIESLKGEGELSGR